MAEVSSVLQKLQEEIQQVHDKVSGLDGAVDNELSTDSGMSYLQVKNHALLNYTKMELFFALLKLQAPEKVQDHAVFKELVRYRTLIERIRPLDRKMTYQVDKMLKVALSGGENLDESLHYAPNPDALAGAQDGQGDGSEEEDGENGEGAKDGIYRAPRLAAVHYEEEEREEIKKAKREERNRKRLQKSAILSELREEFSERPQEIQASGGSTALDKELAKEEAEKRDFEESRFVRVVTSRKDKIRKRQRDSEAMRAEDMGSIDNFAAVQDILSLDKSKHRIPIPETKKSSSNGKTGGIFAHIEVPTEKKRKFGRGNGQPPVSRAATSAPFGGNKASASAASTPASKPASGKKKKVVFSSIF